MKQLLEKMETVSRDITERRSSVTFTPKDLEEVTKWENSLPESALTKYFNTWIKIHRSVAAAQSAAREEEGEDGEQEENIMEDSGSDDGEEEEVEAKPGPSSKKKTNKSKKSKSQDTDSANLGKNVNGLSSAVSSPEKNKKKKKKKGKEKKGDKRKGNEQTSYNTVPSNYERAHSHLLRLGVSMFVVWVDEITMEYRYGN